MIIIAFNVMSIMNEMERERDSKEEGNCACVANDDNIISSQITIKMLIEISFFLFRDEREPHRDSLQSNNRKKVDIL